MARFNVQKAKAAGATDQQIQQLLAQRPDLQVVDAQPAAPQPQGGISDWLPTAGSVVGGIVGAPAGPVGAIGGSALGGAGGEWLRQMIQGEQTDVGNIAKEGAFGGVGGVAGAVAGPAFKAARALVSGGAKTAAKVGTTAAAEGGANVVERLGQSLRKGVIKPKVNPSATAFDEEAALLKGAKDMGLSGPAEVQRAQSAIEYKRLVGDMQNKLAVNNPVLDPNTTKSAVKQAIEGTLNFDAKSPSWKRALELRTGQMGDIKNVQELLKYKLDLGNKLGRAFKKIDLGLDLTTQEETALATWQSIDRIITGAAPELKDVTTQMSILHKLAPGLQTSAQKGVSLPVVGNVPGATPIVQGAMDAGGRALEAVGGSQIPGQVAQVAGATAAQAGTRAVLDPQQAEASGATELPTSDFSGESGTNTPLNDFSGEPVSGKENVKKAFLAAMLTNPKQAAQLQKIYEFGFGSEKTSAAKEKIGIQLATGNEIADQIEKSYKELGKTGRIEGTVKRAASMAGFDPKTTSYEAIRTSMVAPLARIISTEVGVLTDRDFARADALLPKITDTPEEARLKLKQLREAMQRREGVLENSPSSSDLLDFSALGGTDGSMEQFAN